MKGAPWFKFYPSDFMAGVAELTSEERGSYISLLCHQWATGDLPGERMRMERLAGGPVSDAVAGKFVPATTEGRVFNVRLESHREEAQRRGNAGTAAAAKRWDKQTDATALRPHCADDATALRPDMQLLEARGQRLEDRGERAEPETTPLKPPAKRVAIVDDADAGYPDEFLRIWNAWPQGKRGNKGAALKAWKKAKALRSVDFMLKSIEAHKAHDPKWWEGEYIPHASTWLNQRGFDTDPTPQAAPKRFDESGRELF